jgi:PAS domain-containing protein
MFDNAHPRRLVTGSTALRKDAMQDETQRLKSKLDRLEEVLEKQRWTQKDQLLKFEKTVDKLEHAIADYKFSADYCKEQIARYQLVFNNLSEGIYAMDSTGNVLAMNPRATELIDEQDIAPVLLEAISGECVQRRITIDDSLRTHTTVNVNAHPLRDEENKIVGSVAVIRMVEAPTTAKMPTTVNS